MTMVMEGQGGGQKPPAHRNVAPYGGRAWDFDIDLILDGRRFAGSTTLIVTPMRENVVDRLRLLASAIADGRFTFEDGS